MNYKKLLLILILFLSIFNINVVNANTLKNDKKVTVITKENASKTIKPKYLTNINKPYKASPMAYTYDDNPADSGAYHGGDEISATCKGILGKDLIDMIQTIVNIMRIAVPILLIVYGIIDFGKATFSYDEGEMKKAQGRFIKRLIIGITFFLIPVVIQLLLRIGHTIWPEAITADICGLTF